MTAKLEAFTKHENCDCDICFHQKKAVKKYRAEFEKEKDKAVREIGSINTKMNIRLDVEKRKNKDIISKIKGLIEEIDIELEKTTGKQKFVCYIAFKTRLKALLKEVETKPEPIHRLIGKKMLKLTDKQMDEIEKRTDKEMEAEKSNGG